MLPKYTKNYHKFGKDNQCNEITRHLNRKNKIYFLNLHHKWMTKINQNKLFKNTQDCKISSRRN